jgi:hypothetical protein
MKIESDPHTGTVVVILTAKEAVRLASQLVKAAMASGGSVEEREAMEREG